MSGHFLDNETSPKLGISDNLIKKTKPKTPSSKSKLLLRIQKYFASSACVAIPLADLVKFYEREYQCELFFDCLLLSEHNLTDEQKYSDLSIVEMFLISEGMRILRLEYADQLETFVIHERMREEVDVENCLPPKGKKRKKGRGDDHRLSRISFESRATSTQVYNRKRQSTLMGGLAGITARTHLISVNGFVAVAK
ncbi:hypothetical protein HK096_002119, partial [Nowakowskiella sp. JEL0078]